MQPHVGGVLHPRGDGHRLVPRPRVDLGERVVAHRGSQQRAAGGAGIVAWGEERGVARPWTGAGTTKRTSRGLRVRENDLTMAGACEALHGTSVCTR